MARLTRPQHKNSEDKQNLLLLACILRLRVQPLLDYSEIADLLFSMLPDVLIRFAKKAAPKEVKDSVAKNGIKPWVVVWLEKVFDLTEHAGTGAWLQARSWERKNVDEILGAAGLYEKQYTVAQEEEIDCKCSPAECLTTHETSAIGMSDMTADYSTGQIRWRRDGDWRAGSDPLDGSMNTGSESEGSQSDEEPRMPYGTWAVVGRPSPGKSDAPEERFNPDSQEIRMMKDDFDQGG